MSIKNDPEFDILVDNVLEVFDAEIADFLKRKITEEGVKVMEYDVVLLILELSVTLAVNMFFATKRYVKDPDDKIDYDFLSAKFVNTIRDILIIEQVSDKPKIN